MRTVHLNGKWLGQRFTGVQRYSDEIAKKVVAADDIRFVLHVPKGAEAPTWAAAHQVDLRHSPLRGVLFDQLYLPVATRGQLLLNFGGIAPLLKRRQLVTFHDATPFRFPRTFTRSFVALYFVAYFAISRIAQQLSTVSEFSKRELADVLHVKPSRFIVVPGAVDSWALEEMERPDVTWTGPYYLIVGTVAHHKNMAAPARAVAETGRHVVLVGASSKQPGDSAGKIFADTGVSFDSGVSVVQRLSDAELRWLYRHATALVFPSLYEGFGLPVLEAQMMGCPVVASTAASIPEVAGDGALYFDPMATEELVRQLDSLDQDHEFAAELSERGRMNSERFSWQRSADRILSWVRSNA